MLFSRLNWRFLFTGALVLGCFQGLFAQDNKDIYFKYCSIHPRPDCYDPATGTVDSVGRDVKNLGGNYKFCLKTDTIMGIAPLRVILVLDRSGSMCNMAGVCRCAEGDSSGYCMQNDTTNQRVEAAHQFVDSLRAKSPLSEVGVVRFWVQAEALGISSLSSDENVTQIHEWIDLASCESPQGNLSQTTGNLFNGTDIGFALETALELSDFEYATMDPSVQRHIILLTDGAWDDVDTRSPDVVVNNYSTSTGYPLPTIHGVFLSDSISHVLHGYPPQGCSITGEVVDLTQLEYASVTLTGGKFFRGSTPQTVVSNFDSLLNMVIEPIARELVSMTVTNLTNGQSSTGSNIQIVTDAVANETHYEATIDDIALVDGMNQIEVTQVITNPSTGIDSTVTTVVNIFRTTDWTSTIDPVEYVQYCVSDTTSISITVTPPLLRVNEPFTVQSTVRMKENFILNNVEVRVFTRFPDTDAGSVAVFHLEDNLTNSANPASPGTGTVTYTTTEALFDKYSVSQGTFSTSVGNLTGDFTLEAWVRPVSGAAATDIFTGSGNAFGIDAEGHLTFTVDGTQIVKSSVVLDANSWSHIGAVKTNGTVTLFINGVNCTSPTAFSGTFAGAMSITCPAGGMLDEVRISNINRMRAGSDFLRLDIPSVPNISWTLAGQPAAVQPSLTLTPEMWNAGNISFQFSSPVAGKLVVNFQHLGDSLTQWGKNGNAVYVAADLEGPFITKAVYTNGPFEGIYDTLVVYFSEPVRCDSLKKNIEPGASFQIYDTLGQLKPEIFLGAYYKDNTNCPATNLIDQVTIIVKVNFPNVIKPKKDSILLVGSAVDTAGNYPDTTKKRLVDWGPGPGVKIVAVKNLDRTNPMQIADGIRARTGETAQTGRLVFVRTRGPLIGGVTPNGESTYAKTVIFDVVGNVVAVDVPLKRFLDDEREYYVLWDGLNRYGRRVGEGAYLFRATVQYESEPEKYVPLQTKILINWGTTP